MVKQVAKVVLTACKDNGRGIRVAVDGRDASGKTTLTNHLAKVLSGSGVHLIRSSIDQWHNPEDVRHQKGRLSPVGYYEDSFDVGHLRSELLRPLGPDGNGEYRLSHFDYRRDAHAVDEIRNAAVPFILLFDGVFLLRPELLDQWDLTIYVDVTPSVSLARGVERDSATIGGRAVATDRYQPRYLPGQAIYDDSVAPRYLAQIVIDNNDFNLPVITKMPNATTTDSAQGSKDFGD
jgi:uridine kinase